MARVREELVLYRRHDGIGGGTCFAIGACLSMAKLHGSDGQLLCSAGAFNSVTSQEEGRSSRQSSSSRIRVLLCAMTQFQIGSSCNKVDLGMVQMDRGMV